MLLFFIVPCHLRVPESPYICLLFLILRATFLFSPVTPPLLSSLFLAALFSSCEFVLHLLELAASSWQLNYFFLVPRNGFLSVSHESLSIDKSVSGFSIFYVMFDKDALAELLFYELVC